MQYITFLKFFLVTDLLQYDLYSSMSVIKVYSLEALSISGVVQLLIIGFWNMSSLLRGNPMPFKGRLVHPNPEAPVKHESTFHLS